MIFSLFRVVMITVNNAQDKNRGKEKISEGVHRPVSVGRGRFGASAEVAALQVS